jgi:hypothetical protein
VYSNKHLSTDDLLQVEQAELAVDMIYNSNIFSRFLAIHLHGIDNCFGYFSHLGQYLIQNNINKSATDKKRLFQLVIQHLGQKYPDIDLDFPMDCLTFDWLHTQSTHYYPEFFEAEHCNEFKNKIYLTFKDFWQEHQQEKLKSTFKPKLKNVLFFAARCTEFKKAFFDGNDGFVKVDNDGYFVRIDYKNKEMTFLAIDADDYVIETTYDF